ncbi:(3R)-3-hydroxyacyl-CoA dehydrogenase-like [Acropora muricata]|uniref:(3R)-3-hydroxyacyl-CoA dehydrogenase-like n=1 Tax=Acropora muricata TaxID=159855 RepID=UPI0010FCBB08|nr:estradiol 17-beta-dehydrogenase 8-like isoform X1 [Acropora millepora]
MAAGGMSLVGRLALVTGAASGIGRAVCHAFATEGANVVVTDLNNQGIQETVDSLPKHADNRHSSYSLDVTSGDEIRKVLEYIINGYRKPPCVLVNSAGITSDDFLLKMDEEKFDKVIDVNLKGTFLVTQAVAKVMVDQGVANGAIVNLASIVGKVGNLGQVNYSASKAGVEGMTRTCAKELARFGIRCNAVLPGFIQTPMTDAVPDKVLEKLKKQIPLQRLGNPSDVADVVTFLASDRSSYITGTSIEITGGLFM